MHCLVFMPQRVVIQARISKEQYVSAIYPDGQKLLSLPDLTSYSKTKKSSRSVALQSCPKEQFTFPLI